MTMIETRGSRGLFVEVAVTLIVWIAAGVINSGGFIMGTEPSAAGVVATLVVLVIWLSAGWLAGSGSKAGFVRFGTVFWLIVVAGGPLVFWALTAAPGMSVMQGGWLLPLLLFVVAAPLYGLVGMLPYQLAVVWTSCIGATVFVSALGAYSAGRHIGRRAARPNKGIDADKPAV